MKCASPGCPNERVGTGFVMCFMHKHERAAVKPALTEDSAARKAIPLARGLLDYFPAACAAVAEVSRIGNDKHNPGEPLHHSRGKSSDHADCILRHLVDRGTTYVEDVQGQPVTVRHSAALAWRALALLQEELEAEGAPLARGAKLPAKPFQELSVGYVEKRPITTTDLVETLEAYNKRSQELARKYANNVGPEPGLYAVDTDGEVRFTPITAHTPKKPIETDLDALKARTIPR